MSSSYGANLIEGRENELKFQRKFDVHTSQ